MKVKFCPSKKRKRNNRPAVYVALALATWQRNSISFYYQIHPLHLFIVFRVTRAWKLPQYSLGKRQVDTLDRTQSRHCHRLKTFKP